MERTQPVGDLSVFGRSVLSLHPMPVIRSDARHRRALSAAADLLGRLRIDFMFVGNVALSGWLGAEVTSGPIDLVAVLKPEQKNQVVMMGTHRGFRVDREELDSAEELDLIPLHFVDEEGDVRVHVLVASNALYGRMVAGAKAATIDGRDGEVRVPSAEDFALLLIVAEDEVSARRIMALPEFDRHSLNERLVSIGLPGMVVHE